MDDQKGSALRRAFFVFVGPVLFGTLTSASIVWRVSFSLRSTSVRFDFAAFDLDAFDFDARSIWRFIFSLRFIAMPVGHECALQQLLQNRHARILMLPAARLFPSGAAFRVRSAN
jgi:hypothetical protein